MIARADNLLGLPLLTAGLTLLAMVQTSISFPHNWLDFIDSPPFKNDDLSSRYQSSLQSPVYPRNTKDDYAPTGYKSFTHFPENADYAINEPENQATLSPRNAPISIDFVQADEKIIFPTEDNLSPAQRFVPDPASVCKGTTYCEHSSDYPENYIQNTIRVQENLKYFTGFDEIVNIAQRIDFPPEDTPLCISTEEVVYPKLAKNNENEWYFIINQQNFTQGVRIETCHKEGSACNIFEDFANGYRTTCKQKYIYRQLVAVTGNGTILPKMFPFAASCCCHVKFTGNLITRMGLNLIRANQTTAHEQKKSNL